MTADRDRIRALVLDVLAAIAPEVDAGSIDPAASLRQQADLDSFDFLQLCIRIAERTGVDVPEADYGRLATLDSCVEYLAARRART